MKNLSRRKFLKSHSMGAVALNSGLSNLLFHSLLTQLFASAKAQAAEMTTGRYYVNINFNGGPPRYMFDNWLKTQVSEPELTHGSYNSTSFVFNSAGIVSGSEHKLYPYNNYLVPQVFQNLGNQKAEILDSFLVIRGFGTGIDGHAINSKLQQHPLASAPSIGGLFADASAHPYQAVRYPGGGGSFSSEKSLSLNHLNRMDPLGTLLGPIRQSNRTRNLVTEHQEAFDEVRRALASIGGKNRAVQIAKANLDKSYELLKSSFGEIEKEWPSLVEKYDRVITSAIRNQFIPGITATHDGKKQLAFTVDQSDPQFDTGTSDGYLKSGSNACAIAEYATTMLPQNFALAEFCIKNNLVTSFLMNTGSSSQLNLSPGQGSNFFEMGNDMHGGGGYVAMVKQNTFYSGLLQGLLLFKNELEKVGKWQNTVVHMTSEFDRSVRKTGGGSGHGTEQMISSVYSGTIKGGPYVVGNVSTPADPETTKLISQGIAHPIKNYNTTDRPTPIMMASTVSELFDFPNNPWKNFQAPLIKRNQDGTLFLPFGRGEMFAV